MDNNTLSLAIQGLLILGTIILVSAIVYCQIIEMKRRNRNRMNDYGFKNKKAQ